jgi:hypothetical protein
MEDLIKQVAFSEIEKSQDNWGSDDNEKGLIEVLAFNDGVLAMMNALLERLEEEKVNRVLGPS